MATASSKAKPVAIKVVEVKAPARCSSPIARLMPGVRPKSSALMMSREAMGNYRWRNDKRALVAATAEATNGPSQ